MKNLPKILVRTMIFGQEKEKDDCDMSKKSSELKNSGQRQSKMIVICPKNQKRARKSGQRQEKNDCHMSKKSTGSRNPG